MMKAYLFALAALSPLVLAAEPIQQLNLKDLPGAATMVENVVVPVPTEIFGVLDKQGKPQWAEVLRPLGKTPTKAPGPREQTALLLGTVIAEGFIAVESTNSEEVKNIGRSVLALSNALSVQKVVVARSKAIIDGADRKEWQQVRRELDKAQHEVQDAMHELSDDELSQLVSLGGWMRGTEALATVVMQKYTKDGAELLHQPVLVDYFIRRLENGTKFKNKPLVEKMREGLKSIRPLLGKEGEAVPEKTVEEIRVICERLNNLIHAKEKQ